VSSMPDHIRTVTDLYQVITGCSSADAERASAAICQTPGAAKALAVACGVSTAGVGAGGLLVVTGQSATVSGIGASTGIPVWAIGAALGTVSGMGAKRFCTALQEQTGRSVAQAMQMHLGGVRGAE
jgi:hypothetical protein